MENKEKQSIGEIIRKLRKDNGMTQAQLSKALGVSKSSVEKYEAGKVVPDMLKIEKIATIFNVGIDTIMGGMLKRSANDYIDKCLEVVKPIHDAELKAKDEIIKDKDETISKLINLVDYMKNENEKLRLIIKEITSQDTIG